MKKDFEPRPGPVNDLEILLFSSANEPQLRYEFYRQLMQHDLLVLTLPDDPSRPWTFERYGQRFMPAFSSLDRMIEFAGLGADQHCLRMSIPQVTELLSQGEELYLNPESNYGRAFTRRELQALVHGKFEFDDQTLRIQASDEARLRTPASVPAKLTLGLISFCASHSLVDAAHLAEIATPDAPNQFHWIVGLSTHARKHWESEDLLIELCLHMQQHAEPGCPMDFCLLQDFPPMAKAVEKQLVKRVFRRALSA